MQYTPPSAVGMDPSTISTYGSGPVLTRSSTASAWAPAPAMIVSWYSHETTSSTTSATVGWLLRSIDSVLPAQSWNSSQTTTGLRLGSSRALTICGVIACGSASSAVIADANPRNRRRLTPRLASADISHPDPGSSPGGGVAPGSR